MSILNMIANKSLKLSLIFFSILAIGLMGCSSKTTSAPSTQASVGDDNADREDGDTGAGLGNDEGNTVPDSGAGVEDNTDNYNGSGSETDTDTDTDTDTGTGSDDDTSDQGTGDSDNDNGSDTGGNETAVGQFLVKINGSEISKDTNDQFNVYVNNVITFNIQTDIVVHHVYWQQYSGGTWINIATKSGDSYSYFHSGSSSTAHFKGVFCANPASSPNGEQCYQSDEITINFVTYEIQQKEDGFTKKESFLFDLYYYVFDRLPDAAGFSYWKEELTSKPSFTLAMCREYSLNFARSSEFVSRLNNYTTSRQKVEFLYRRILRRIPQEFEVNYYLGSGDTFDQMTQIFIDSPEYQSICNNYLD